MNIRRISIIAIALTLVVGATWAQDIDQLPGYVALDDLEVFDPEQVKVDVDLRESMVKMAAGAMQDDEKLAQLLDSVRRIRVKAGSPGATDPASIRAAIDSAVSRLESSGWYRMVTIRGEDEAVYVLAKEADGVIQGLTAMILDGDEEVALVNIAGSMDPELVGSLMSHMDDLDDLDLDFDTDD